MSKVAIFGSSGFASEVADVCWSLGIKDVVFIAPSDSVVKSHNDIPVVSEGEVDRLTAERYSFAFGVSDPKLKKKIFSKFTHLNFINLIHPSATFGREQLNKVLLAKGVVIAAGVRFMSGISVGDFVAVSLNATIGHDSVISSFVSIMPGANISGNVELADAVYIGSGAVVLQGTDAQKLKLGAGLIVGAGAVVNKSCDGPGTVVGVPAKRIK